MYKCSAILECLFIMSFNRIGDVMVSVLVSNAVDRGFDPRSGQTKDYEIGICCFSVQHAALRRKSKDWLPRIQNNVSKWSDISIHGLLFRDYKNPAIKRFGLVQSGPHHHFIEK